MPIRDWTEYDNVDVPGFDELSEVDRAALDLHIVDDLPYGAVAERLRITPGAARMRVHRALSRLRGSAP